MIPASPGVHPGLANIDASRFWNTYDQVAPPLLRFGLRASVILLTWLAVLRHGRPFHRLNPERQDRFLRSAAASRYYLLRQLVATIKLIACFAYLQDAQVRNLLDPQEVR